MCVCVCVCVCECVCVCVCVCVCACLIVLYCKRVEGLPLHLHLLCGLHCGEFDFI